jgi:hypothetical protein
MEKMLFWTSMGGISSHCNAFSFLDPIRVPPCTHLRLNWHGQSNHMHDLWCPKELNIKAFLGQNCNNNSMTLGSKLLEKTGIL